MAWPGGHRAITASSILHTFKSDGARALIAVELRSYGRELAALNTPDPDLGAAQTALAYAERHALPALRELVTAMTSMPGAADGLDDRTSWMAATGPDDWEALRGQQARHAELAEAAGQRGDVFQLALFLAALSLTLAMLATAEPASAVAIRHGSAGLLALALLAVVAAWVA